MNLSRYAGWGARLHLDTVANSWPPSTPVLRSSTYGGQVLEGRIDDGHRIPVGRDVGAELGRRHLGRQSERRGQNTDRSRLMQIKVP